MFKTTTNKKLIALFFSFGVLAVLGVFYSSCNQHKANLLHPNIILILVDDLGIGDLSCYGSTYNHTPHIDGIAKRGIRFTNFYANSSVCSPTRAAILTGLHPNEIGVRGAIRTEAQNNFGNLNDEVMFISSYLKQLNYHTSYIGKWHLGLSSPDLPNERGFDTFKGFLGDMVDSYWQHKRHNLNYMRLNKTVIETEGHLTFEYSKWVIEEIQKLSRAKQPFFLTLSYNAPHQPIEAPNEWLDSIKLRLPEKTNLQIKYTAFVEYLDWNIGRVIDALKKEKLYDNTLILFLSDNGGAVGYGSDVLNYKGAKGTLYEGGIRIPFIVSQPDKLAQNSTTIANASTVDILPTVLDYIGYTQPFSTNGHSLVNLLTKPSSSKVDHKVKHLDDPSNPMFFIREDNDVFLKAVIQNNWKLIQSGFGNAATFELYLLPDEDKLLNQKHPEKLKALKQLLNE